jgi:hypothetical protein
VKERKLPEAASKIGLIRLTSPSADEDSPENRRAYEPELGRYVTRRE